MEQSLGGLVAEEDVSRRVGGHHAVFNGVEHVGLAQIQVQQLGGVVAPQTVFQQGHDAVGQGQGHRQHDAQQHQTVAGQHQAPAEDVRGEDRGHDKAHQLSPVVIHGVKGPALLPVGAVSGGDKAVLFLKPLPLVPGELRLAARTGGWCGKSASRWCRTPE